MSIRPRPNRLRDLRGGLSQQALAKKAGIPQNYVSRWELGHDFPSDRYLQVLAHALGCKVSLVAQAFYEPAEEGHP